MEINHGKNKRNDTHCYTIHNSQPLFYNPAICCQPAALREQPSNDAVAFPTFMKLRRQDWSWIVVVATASDWAYTSRLSTNLAAITETHSKLKWIVDTFNWTNQFDLNSSLLTPAHVTSKTTNTVALKGIWKHVSELVLEAATLSQEKHWVNKGFSGCTNAKRSNVERLEDFVKTRKKSVFSFNVTLGQKTKSFHLSISKFK